MKYILTPEQMRKADSSAIKEFGVPSLILMENAANEAADFIIDLFHDADSDFHIAVLCGSGNNGGDGFALTRHLNDFFSAEIIWIGEESKMSEETRINFTAAKKIGIPLKHIENEDDLRNMTLKADCFVDALIGVGGSENLKGIVEPLLHKVNEAKGVKIAVDAPTGLNTLTGFAHKHCFIADYTITMYGYKSGLLLNKGPDVSGEVIVAYLGAPDKILEEISNKFFLEEKEIVEFLPERERVSSKFDYGRVLVVAGSESMPGAAALAANAAISSGAGHVYLASVSMHNSLLPEVIQIKLSSTTNGTISYDSYGEIMKRMEQCKVLALGSGLGENHETFDLVRKLVGELGEKKIIILDADALKAFEKDHKFTKNVILTPHSGEMARFTGLERNDIELNSAFLGEEWAEKLNCIMLLKHVPTIISDGAQSCWNLTGNPGMASAGSGDVLTGIIAGIASQTGDPFISAALGAFIHGRAGDKAAEALGYQALTASSLIKYLGDSFQIGGHE